WRHANELRIVLAHALALEKFPKTVVRVRALDAADFLSVEVLDGLYGAVLRHDDHVAFVVVQEHGNGVKVLAVGSGNEECAHTAPAEIDLPAGEGGELRGTRGEFHEIDVEAQLLEILLAKGDVSRTIHDGLHAGVDAERCLRACD